MKKVLFVATVVRLHINMFHQPFLKWFHQQGWQVDVAANNDYDTKEECIIPNCDHFYCLPFERSPFRKENIQAYRQLKQILDREHYDIVHCHTPIGAVVARLAASDTRKHGTKVIYTAHGFHFYQGAPKKNWLMFYPVERLLARKTDLLITMNQEDYQRAKGFGTRRVEKVNGVGINLNRFTALSEAERQEVRQSLHLQETDIFAIVVGRLDREKNHGVLIEASARINDPRFHLFICGDGPLEEDLTKQITALGMENQIHLLGFRRDVEKLCGAADIYLFASVREGLPVATAEAMACGLPIVASDIRGNRDLIDEGLGGYLEDPMDVEGFVKAVKKILGDEHLRLEMREHNLSKIRDYGVEAVTAQMAELYWSVG